MAHPYSQFREHKARAGRVARVMKSGGLAHSDEAADKKLFKKLIDEHEAKEMKVEGTLAHKRLDKFARGGRTKHKGSVNIAVVVPHGGGPSSQAIPAPAMATPAAPAVPRAPIAPALPGGGPLGAPGAPVPPPGMPMPMRRGGGRVQEQSPAKLTDKQQVKFLRRKDGGKVLGGESTKENLADWAARARSNTRYARGGNVPEKPASPTAWSERQGGTEKTTRAAKLQGAPQGKAGRGSGVGNKNIARTMRKQYP